jgi:hypothetical protein
MQPNKGGLKTYTEVAPPDSEIKTVGSTWPLGANQTWARKVTKVLFNGGTVQ